HAVGQLGDLVGGILGITAAVVEKVAYVVGSEHFNQAFVFALVLGNILELVSAGAESPARRVDQGLDGVVRFQAGVNQLFFQRADDAITAGIDLADLVRVFTCGLDNTAG